MGLGKRNEGERRRERWKGRRGGKVKKINNLPQNHPAALQTSPKYFLEKKWGRSHDWAILRPL